MSGALTHDVAGQKASDVIGMLLIVASLAVVAADAAEGKHRTNVIEAIRIVAEAAKLEASDVVAYLMTQRTRT